MGGTAAQQRALKSSVLTVRRGSIAAAPPGWIFWELALEPCRWVLCRTGVLALQGFMAAAFCLCPELSPAVIKALL